MKALYFNEHGELDVVKYGDVPDPELGPAEVLVRVRACALNFLDIWVRRGWPGLRLEMPPWCGADACEETIQEDIGVTIRCIPIHNKDVIGNCICCGSPAGQRVVFAKAY